MTYLLKLFTNVAFKLADIVPWWGVTSHYIAFVEALIGWSCCNTDSNCFSSFPDNLKYKSVFSDEEVWNKIEPMLRASLPYE